MKAAILSRYNSPLEIEEIPTPLPGPEDVLVKISACGVCGSDVLLAKGGFPAILPVIPGHEASGTIEAVGENVDAVSVGTPVAIYYIDHCTKCEPCLTGKVNMCLNLKRMGVEFNGAFAESVVVPARNVIPVEKSDNLLDIAVLTDAVATPYHALKTIAKAKKDETVVIWGVGGIGSNAVQIAKLFGCQVIAVSRSEEKLSLAREMGADKTIKADSDCVKKIKELTGPGPEIIIQTVGSAEADRTAFEAVGIGTRLVLVGASTDTFQLASTEMIWSESSIYGSRGFTPNEIEEVFDLYRTGKIRADHLTRSTKTVDQINEAIESVGQSDTVRTVIKF
tara:strand:+ start:1169 stop:2179 length:1011 start_codon:yes stop_codon:yes gene_type:complete